MFVGPTGMILLAVLLAVAGVVGGLWQLVKAGARDLLGSAAALGSAMLVGTALEFLGVSGSVIGLVAGFPLAVAGAVRVLARRKESTAAALSEAEEGAASLLVIHDRLDELQAHRPRNTVSKFGRSGALVLMSIFGVEEMARGITEHSWLALLLASAALFFVLSVVGRKMVEMNEAGFLHVELQRLRSAIDERSGEELALGHGEVRTEEVWHQGSTDALPIDPV